MPASGKPQTSELRLLILAPAATSKSTKVASSSDALSTSQTEASSLLFFFLQALTGVAPSRDLTTFAGYTSHAPLSIKNKYYAANINIWCDELPSDQPLHDEDGDVELARWTDIMLSEEAKEVREVIGSIIIVLPFYVSLLSNEQQRSDVVKEYAQYIASVNKVRDLLDDESGRDLATIVALQDMTPATLADRSSGHQAALDSCAQDLEDRCISEHDIFGWDIVSWHPMRSTMESSTDQAGLNEFGEKVGMPRIFEVLEQANWTASSSTFGDHLEGYELAGADDPSGLNGDLSTPGLKPIVNLLSSNTKDPITSEPDEFQREMMGLHFALEDQRHMGVDEQSGSGDELEVDQVMALMSRAAEIRDAGADMSKEERAKFARREVNKLMQEMNIS